MKNAANKPTHVTYENVLDDLGLSPEQLTALKFKAELYQARIHKDGLKESLRWPTRKRVLRKKGAGRFGTRGQSQSPWATRHRPPSAGLPHTLRSPASTYTIQATKRYAAA
jgi:hypothetical protein